MSALRQALSRIEAPKVPLREIQGKTYQAVNVQVQQPRMENNLGKIMELASIGTQQYGKYVAQREEQGQQRKNEILLKNMQPDQIKSMRDEGTLLYQDDFYAMRALERELGRQEAYNADAIVANKIKAGDFATRADMEEFRATLHEEAVTKMAEAYGVNPTSTYYREGLQADIVDRNMTIYNAQALKTDQAKRNETRLVIENNLGSIINTSQNKAQGVIAYLDQARAEGMLNETEYKVAFQKAATNLAETGDVTQMKLLLDSEVTVDGVKTTFGTLIGDDQGNQFVIQAGNKAYSNNQAEQLDFERSINKVVNSDVSTLQGAQAARDELERQWKRVYEMNQNHPMWTAHKAALLDAEARLNSNIAVANERQKKVIKEDWQQTNRFRTIDQRVESRLKGEGVPLGIKTFEETEATGKFTENDYTMYYRRKIDEVMQDETLGDSQKQIKLMTIGGVMKDSDKAGFGAWYNAQMGQIQSELDSVTFAVNAGIDVPDTPTFNQYGNMYAQDPKLFMNVFGDDAQMALNLATAKSLNVDFATYMKGTKSISKMDETQRRNFQQEWSARIDQAGGILKKLSPQQLEVYRGWAAATHGIGFNTAISRINEHAKATFVSVGDIGTVKRSILMTNDNVDSADDGAKILENYMQGKFGSDYKRSQAYSVGDAIIVLNPNGAREVIDRQRFLEIYSQTK